jgi:hypothetical protein
LPKGHDVNTNATQIAQRLSDFAISFTHPDHERALDIARSAESLCLCQHLKRTLIGTASITHQRGEASNYFDVVSKHLRLSLKYRSNVIGAPSEVADKSLHEQTWLYIVQCTHGLSDVVGATIRQVVAIYHR